MRSWTEIVFLFAPVKFPESVLPSWRTSVSLQAGIAIASAIRDAANTVLVFIAGVLSGFLVLGLCSEILIEDADSFCPVWDSL